MLIIFTVFHQLLIDKFTVELKESIIKRGRDRIQIQNTVSLLFKAAEVMYPVSLPAVAIYNKNYKKKKKMQYTFSHLESKFCSGQVICFIAQQAPFTLWVIDHMPENFTISGCL